MPHYRVYILDENGQFIGGIDFACTNDDAAKECATRLAEGQEVVLWRMVARFKFDNQRDGPKRRRSAVP